MNQSRTRRIQPNNYHAETEKDRGTHSEIESLLVSSVRFDINTNYQVDTPEESRKHHRATHGSLIKKNIASNIVIEEPQKCCCQQKLQNINNSLRVLTLTIQQLQSKLNLCFSKQSSLQSKFSDFQCKAQLKQQNEWQQSILMKEEVCSSAKHYSQTKMQITDLRTQLSNLKKVISKLQNRDNQKCIASKLVEHKLEKYKGEQEEKIAELFETIEEIHRLQNKMIKHKQKEQFTFPDEENILPYSIVPHKKMKILKGCAQSLNRTCESTNISYSRNAQNR